MLKCITGYFSHLKQWFDQLLNSYLKLTDFAWEVKLLSNEIFRHVQRNYISLAASLFWLKWLIPKFHNNSRNLKHKVKYPFEEDINFISLKM